MFGNLNQKTFQCDICTKYFKTSKSLREHKSKYHPETIIKAKPRGMPVTKKEEEIEVDYAAIEYAKEEQMDQFIK